MTEPRTYIVTGVGGFVGSALARELLKRGDKVIGFARGDYPELQKLGVQLVRANLSQNRQAWGSYFKGVAGVFHVAAKVDMWGPYKEFFNTNVVGTENVIVACKENEVQRLVFTSSPSVIADGKDLNGVDESYPYPPHHMANYPATKSIAERLALAANGLGSLHTVALRPHLIFGPGDNHFVPMIVTRARSGRLTQVGPGTNLTDLTYIEDCTAAHLTAMDALDSNPVCRGKVYFITQGEPVNMWQWINEVLKYHQLPFLSRKVSTSTAFRIAGVCEAVSKLSLGMIKPLFTRFLISQMTTSHYFSIEAAKRDLGFVPRFSMAEAMRKTFG